MSSPDEKSHIRREVVTDTRRLPAYRRVRGSSTSSSHRAVSPVPRLQACCAVPVGNRYGDLGRRSAGAAALPRSGPSSAVANAPDDGSPFGAPGRRSPTRARRPTSSPRGRSTGSAARRAWPLSSWSSTSMLRRRTSSPISRRIRRASSSVVTTRPSSSPGSSRVAGASPPPRSSSEPAVSPRRAKPGSRERIGCGTCEAPSYRSPRYQRAWFSWTTCTRPAQPSRQLRRRSATPVHVRSTS
jgi:hypothetical protein